MSDNIRDMIESRRHVGVYTSAESFQKKDPRIDRTRYHMAQHTEDMPSENAAFDDRYKDNSNQIGSGVWASDPRGRFNVGTDWDRDEASVTPDSRTGRERFKPLSPDEYMEGLYDYQDELNNFSSDIYSTDKNSDLRSTIKDYLKDTTYFDEDQLNDDKMLDAIAERVMRGMYNLRWRLKDSTEDDARSFGRVMDGEYDDEEEPIRRYNRNQYRQLDDLILDPHQPKIPARERKMWKSASDPLLEAIHQMRYGESFQKKEFPSSVTGDDSGDINNEIEDWYTQNAMGPRGWHDDMTNQITELVESLDPNTELYKDLKAALSRNNSEILPEEKDLERIKDGTSADGAGNLPDQLYEGNATPERATSMTYNVKR